MLRPIIAFFTLPLLVFSASEWESRARAVPSADNIRAAIQKLSGQPHLAGTPGSKAAAEWILGQLKSYGLDADIETFEALLPVPSERVLEMTAPSHFVAKLQEPVVAVDPDSANPDIVPPYNAYSGNGDVTAPLVYVNYGLPADYDTLAEKGIDVKGKIVIVRYGQSFRGVKARVAYEHGAVGCIIYSDPRDDGYFQGDSFPKGAYRPADGVQRGSVLDLGIEPGDPRVSDASTVQRIPVLPISYADATPLLSALSGPVAPVDWRGALPFTYHLGPGAVVHLKVVMNNVTRPLYDVIARIPGSEFPDEWVLYGNHHDAWVDGASDPLSGAAPLLETARALGEISRAGWKPRRTVMFAFWDGEEFGLIGSTEWMEKHTEELNRKLAVYINSDSSGKGTLNAGGSPTLEAAVRDALREVKDPVSGKSLLDEYLARTAKAKPDKAAEFHLAALGSGSDFTPFLQHLGVASLSLEFDNAAGGGVYHSAYDDFYWFSHFEDTDFTYGRALAQLNATVMVRLADAPMLPFEFTRLAAAVFGYVDEMGKLKSKEKVNLDVVAKADAKLAAAADEFRKAWEHAALKVDSAPADQLAAINLLLMDSERDLAPEDGLPGRPWYRNRIYAPGRYTGYAVKTLPGIREAVEAGKGAEATEQAQGVAQSLEVLAGHVREAAGLLGKL